MRASRGFGATDDAIPLALVAPVTFVHLADPEQLALRRERPRRPLARRSFEIRL